MSTENAGTGLRVAIVGAGMGGLGAAIAMRKLGLNPTIYEQAHDFARIGAGIHVAANAVNALTGLGITDEVLAEKAFVNTTTTHRDSASGEVTGTIDHGAASVREYGAPYTTWHRGDLHAALHALVPQDIIQRGRKVVGAESSANGATLTFEDGSAASADVVIAADGVHSPTRAALFEVNPPRFTQRLAYRSIVEVGKVGDPDLDESCKWWGPDRHLVHYYVSSGREIGFTTSVPETEWDVESWSAVGDVEVLRAEFAQFHPRVRNILDAVERVNIWAINAHDPMSTWVAGNVVLIGDACHTVTPYMGQGAALAIEDGVVLARLLARLGGDRSGIPEALSRFEELRRPRTTRVQVLSEANTWGRYGANVGWLYGYNAWNVDLDGAPAASDDPISTDH
ncbi:MAG TPA: FAD-dependent monooxygenase [Solirubrobacteraceae bacterium]|nr:FAD-dependent monooxygenase [Solirubrobacteraceae bacterium]